MKTVNKFLADMLDMETPEASGDIIWCAGPITAVTQQNDEVVCTVPFAAHRGWREFKPVDTLPVREHTIRFRSYGNGVIRMTFDPARPDAAPHDWLLQLDPSAAQRPLRQQPANGTVQLLNDNGACLAGIRIGTMAKDAPGPEITFWPGQANEIRLLAWDRFLPHQPESLPIAYVERDGAVDRVCFSLHAAPHEHFCGTGERFAPLDLAGRTILLENRDALGVNNRRAYKNVPFYLSSRTYGLLALTSASVRLSFADVSTQAVQGSIHDSMLDLFFIGGGSVEAIVKNYRALTGFPPMVPTWSLGMWMSRMTYTSAEQAQGVADRLRKDHFPCDVIHLDSGWFERDWHCDWKFSTTRFPDPQQFLRRMRSDGFRVTLWQLPWIGIDTPLYDLARQNGYLARPTVDELAPIEGSHFGKSQFMGTIDLTNPKAVEWYEHLIEQLLKDGAAAIKADFGEEIDEKASYHAMPVRLLHNAYALLYQKLVFDVTRRTTGEGIIWARSGWIGSQKYPVHWAGDSASTWDGLAATLRGGLHLGLSGFGFWSHDVGGFHGVPGFMTDKPVDALYVRWTQLGVLSSHMRYHGTSDREPYNYPAVSSIVRMWLRLRYALIPYLLQQSRKCSSTGLPVLRAMIFHHADDERCWSIDDQYFLGDDLLAAPVLNAGGVRNVYLPAGEWVDFWTGEVHKGPIQLNGVYSLLHEMPIFVRRGARLRVYPEPVQCTDEMKSGREIDLCFDAGYRGIAQSPLGPLLRFEPSHQLATKA